MALEDEGEEWRERVTEKEEEEEEGKDEKRRGRVVLEIRFI